MSKRCKRTSHDQLVRRMSKNDREIRIRVDGEYLDPQKITRINRRLLAEHFGDENAIHRYEVVDIQDDYARKERVLKVQPKRTRVFLTTPSQSKG